MAAVAEGSVSGSFAAAEEYLAGMFRCKFMRLEIGSLVGTVTKGLFIAVPTAAPEVSFTLSHFNYISAFLRD